MQSRGFRFQQLNFSPAAQFDNNWGGSPISKDLLVIKRTPIEFLARHFGEGEGDDDEQVESIANKLEALSAKKDATMLRNTYRLLRASDDEYVDVVREIVKTAKGPYRRPHYINWRKALTTAIEIWRERNLKADVSPLLIEFAARSYGWEVHDGIPYQADSGLLMEYLQEFAEVNELQEIEKFMTKLRLNLIGNEEQQLELSKLLVDSKNFSKEQ